MAEHATERSREETTCDITDTTPSTSVSADRAAQDEIVRSSRRAPGHLWDSLRLRRAQIFATNTTRSLSLSRNTIFSQSNDNCSPSEVSSNAPEESNSTTKCDTEYATLNPEYIGNQENRGTTQSLLGISAQNQQTDQCGSESQDMDTSDSGLVCANVCTTSKPDSSTPGNPAKEECLCLIDKIWKDGLDRNLEVVRQRKRSLRHDETEHSTAAGACDKCIELKRNLLSLQSGDVQDSIEDFEVSSEATPLQQLNLKILCTKQVSGTKQGNSSLRYMDEESNCMTECEQSVNSPSTVAYLHKETSVTTVEGGVLDHAMRAPGPPPLKKAKYSWQVKNKAKGECLPFPRSYDDEQGSSVDRRCFVELASCSGLQKDCSYGSANTNKLCTKHPESQISQDGILSYNQTEKKSKDAGDCGQTRSNLKSRVSDHGESVPHVVKKLEPSPRQPKSDTNSEHLSPGRLQRLSTEVYPSGGQRRQNNRDFHMLTHALTQLDYVERWQCQHVAKALVDNAINKTLEEMGLSPDENSNRAGYREQRSRIEDAGVSQAILSQGLRRYSPSSYRMRRLNPIISRLTRVSEHLFSDNLRGSLRSLNEAAAAGDDDGDDDGDVTGEENPRDAEEELSEGRLDELGVISPDDDEGSVKSGPVVDETSNVLLPDSGESFLATEGLERDMSISTCSVTSDNVPMMEHTKESSVTVSLTLPNQSDVNDVTEENENDICYASSLPTSVCDEKQSQPEDEIPATLAVISTDPNTNCDSNLDIPTSSFVLDQAVNAVIFERGLQF